MMPGDISSSQVQLAWQKTSPKASRSPTRSASSTTRPLSHVTSRVQSRITSGVTSRTKDEDEDGDEYHVELLEYEWPDLPPLPCMKDAITRQKVSNGISYLLPVDKGKNSINSRYRTDLRAMFQEPYANDDLGYDDNKVKLSAKIHFDTNSVDTKWSKKQFETIPVSLNSESENVRKLYANSAPPRGSRGGGIDSDKMRTRSSLFLPMKKEEHPEAQKLREEVEKIIQDVKLQDAESDVIEEDEEEAIRQQMTRKESLFRKSKSRVIVRESVGHAGMIQKPSRLKLTAEKFKSYAQLKKTKPPKKLIPDLFSSKFCSQTKNQEIWDWLHHGEEITDFQYFLSVCG